MVLAAENDETRQTVNLLVVCLVGIAVGLAALTVWYWFHTDPKRRGQADSRLVGGTPIVEARNAAGDGGGGVVRSAAPDQARADGGLPVDQPSTRDRTDDAGPASDAEPADDAAPVLVPVGEGATQSDDDRVDEAGDHAVERVAASSAEAPGDALVDGPLMARQTWDFVAAAKRAEDGDRAVVPPPPSAPRIAVPPRSGVAVAETDEADELAVVRRRREQEAARGLSDEVWDSVRRSVFDKLDG